MALTFPSSPTNGQIYTYSGKSYTWNGTAWTPNAPTFTASRALATDSNGSIAASSVTTTELGYVSGVTSAVQTQLDGKAAIDSQTLTGTPKAPTASADTNTTQLATTAFVVGQASSSTPANNGTAAVGTSLKYARADHVHASDTTKASLSGASFTGSVGVASAGLVFSDSTTQVTAGVPSLTTIKSTLSSNTSTSALSSALTYRDALVPLSGAVNLTIDADGTNSITFPIGTSIDFYQSSGTGAVFVQGSGVTLQYTPGLKFRATYSSATITKVATNTWLVYGDLSA
jgi:hypothetical protein